MTSPRIVIDNCALLNLYSAPNALAGVSTMWGPILLLPIVNAEAMYIRRGGNGLNAKDRVPVDLTPLISDGTLISSARLGSAEDALFVEFAGEIDDGEAECCAVAITRGLPLLTDDNAAIRLLRGRGYGHLVITTPDALKTWIETADLTITQAREVIRLVQECGNYAPSKKHPLHPWWLSMR